MDDKGNYPRFMSQAVRRPLEVLTGSLVDNKEVEMVDNTAEARSFLNRRFNVDLNRGGRGEKNIIHNLALSDRRGELGERVGAIHSINDVSRPKIEISSEILRQAEIKYKELYPDEVNK
jgi:hypothetical protein